MDIVLEIFDYYLLDKTYSSLLPKSLNTTISDSIGKLGVNELTSSFYKNYNENHNSTVTSASATSNLNVPLRALMNKLQTFQNTDEVYGEVPKLFPLNDYTNDSLLLRTNIFRQAFSIFIITAVFGWLLYFSVAYMSYLTVFDKKIFNHPRYLKNQIWLEIQRASTAIPIMVLLTVPFFLMELQGFSKLYMEVNASTGGWKAILLQVPLFILFTDCGIYFIHRWLHWPSVYKILHKPHHKWIVCTPFASHAFHPVDGWAQSLPYHIYPMIFPLHKVSYLLLFTFVNFWTVMIHDGQYLSNDPVVNGTACHTIHHLYFNYNYGQFTTLWDRLGRSYRRPDDNLFVRDNKKEEEVKVWNEQTQKMEEIRGKLEGKGDDRVYH